MQTYCLSQYWMSGKLMLMEEISELLADWQITQLSIENVGIAKQSIQICIRNR